MYKKSVKDHGFNNDYYWASDENKTSDGREEGWYQNFVNGGKMFNAKSLPARVRLVKTVSVRARDHHKDLLVKEIKNKDGKIIRDEKTKRIKIEVKVEDWNKSRKDYPEPNLSSIFLEGKNLTGVNFSKTNLTSSNLNDANLSNANLGGAVLKGSILQNAKLNNANLTGADLSYCDVEGADFSGSTVTGIITKGVDLTKAKNFPSG